MILYVSACIWLYMYVSVLYVLEGAYLYLCVFMCMYLHVSSAYINTCISVFKNAYMPNSCICMYHICILYVCVFLHVTGMYHVCVSMCKYCMYWPMQCIACIIIIHWQTSWYTVTCNRYIFHAEAHFHDVCASYDTYPKHGMT